MRRPMKLARHIYTEFKWMCSMRRNSALTTGLPIHIIGVQTQIRLWQVWTLTKKMMSEPSQKVAFTIPIFEPLPSQYYIKCAF